MDETGQPVLEIESTAELRMLGMVHLTFALTSIQARSLQILKLPPEHPHALSIYFTGILVGALLLSILCLTLLRVKKSRIFQTKNS